MHGPRGRPRGAARGRVPVLLPAALLASDPLPASWEVTSDSIAAWVAGAAHAARLVLVKPVEGLYRDWPADGKPLARLSVDELAELRAAGKAAGVDQHLPEALRSAGVEAWVIDGREPARLVTLLERGSHRGDAHDAASRGALAFAPPLVGTARSTSSIARPRTRSDRSACVGIIHRVSVL